MKSNYLTSWTMDATDPGFGENIVSRFRVCKLRTALSSFEVFGDAKQLPRFRLLSARRLGCSRAAHGSRWKCVISDGRKGGMTAVAVSRVSRMLEDGSVRVGDTMELVAFRIETLRKGGRICVLLCVRQAGMGSRWTYSAPNIDWERSGFHRGYCESMNRYMSNLKQTVTSLRLNDTMHASDIHLGVRPFDSDFDNADKPMTVLHPDEELMRPHWDELIDALAGNSLAGATVTVIGVVLPHSFIESVSMAVAGKRISGLVMRRAMIRSARGSQTGPGPLHFLLRMVRCCNALRSVRYEGYRLADPLALKSLVVALGRHPSVREFLVGSCFLHSASLGYVGIIKQMYHLRVLDCIALDEIGLGKQAALLLSKFIKTNPPLESLSLRGNFLDDQDASTIIVSLRNNTNLGSLNLSGNILTPAGCDRASSLGTYDDRSLRLLYESNHSCRLVVGRGLSVLQNNHPSGAVTGRMKWMKLHSAMAHRNASRSNVTELLDEFGENYRVYLPFIFGTIIRVGGPLVNAHLAKASLEAVESDSLLPRLRIPSLSIVYEILRDSCF